MKKEKTQLAKDKNEFVSSVITNKEGNVLILKRRKDLKLDPGKFDFCSGHIKEGETPMQAMYRELKEEIGLLPEQIMKMEKIGIIETPHEKLNETLCHLYLIQIDKSIEEINQMIQNVENPEMEKAEFLKDIDLLTQMQEETNLLRTKYTKQMKYALEGIKQRINKGKEDRRELCEEK